MTFGITTKFVKISRERINSDSDSVDSDVVVRQSRKRMPRKMFTVYCLGTPEKETWWSSTQFLKEPSRKL